MTKIFYLHWNEAEWRERVGPLRAAGFTITGHWDTRTHAKIADRPDAFVISLDRLPSHGRAVAEWCRESKARRAIPLIFVDGTPEAVEKTRALAADAAFTTSARLVAELRRLTRPRRSTMRPTPTRPRPKPTRRRPRPAGG